MYSKASGLQHGFEILGHVEGRLGLALDLVDGDAVGDLDQGQAVGKVDVEHALSAVSKDREWEGSLDLPAR